MESVVGLPLKLVYKLYVVDSVMTLRARVVHTLLPQNLARTEQLAS